VTMRGKMNGQATVRWLGLLLAVGLAVGTAAAAWRDDTHEAGQGKPESRGRQVGKIAGAGPARRILRGE